MKGWRTIVGNVVGLLLLVLADPRLADLMPGASQYIQYAIVGFNFVMRFLTTGAVGAKN